MMDKVVPKFYRCLRQRRRLSQTDFGAAIGKKRKTISKWEIGKARPCYEAERRLLLSHGCSWQETLEILSEVLAETIGRPITFSFEEQGLDQPTHPLAIADRRLREGGSELPDRLRQQLQRRILEARGNVARTEREIGELVEHVETCIEACAETGGTKTSQQD